MMTSIVKQQSLTALLDGFLANDMPLQECQLSDISMDSRRVTPGTLFLALSARREDRLAHMQQAIDRGAFAVLVDTTMPVSEQEQHLLAAHSVMAYSVDALAQKAGYIAARFYQHPSERLTVIAVTGTNGKTSVSQFIAQALESCGHACGVIGTMGAGRISDLELTGMTTPDAVTMQRLLAGFELEGCAYVVMEASSHALDQGRLNSVDVNVAVLTNLSRDHLDYHQTMAHYAAAKMRLFELPSITRAVINIDDTFGQHVLEKLDKRVKALSYSREQHADISVVSMNSHINGVELTLQLAGQQGQLSLPVLGRFNVENVLATVAVMRALHFDLNDSLQAVSHCRAVSGRMEVHGKAGQPTVVIDYAHTPDALEQALKALREHLPDNGHLWCVFGCGGDRDKGKRPLMGQIAEQSADKVIITADNPRTEDHKQIVTDILAGCQRPENIYIEHDRQAAIQFAITHAKANDIVLVAGKGHEAYQEINQVKYPFSDAQAVTTILADLENTIYNVAGGH